MTRSIPLLALTLAAVVAGATGCATATRTLGAAPAAVQLAAPDRAFIATAAGSGMYEVEAGKLAATRAQSPQVRSYGQMLVDHHTRSNAELLALARRHNYVPPVALPADQQTKLTALARLSGAQFDREFIRVAGVHDHTTAITLFEQGQRTVADRDLQAWITKTLPILRQHLQQAQGIAGMLAG